MLEDIKGWDMEIENIKKHMPLLTSRDIKELYKIVTSKKTRRLVQILTFFLILIQFKKTNM